MPTAKLPPYPPEEVARRGEAIYEEKIRSIVESNSKGRRLIIDIETGNYPKTFGTRSPRHTRCWNGIPRLYFLECGWAIRQQQSLVEAGVCRMINGIVNEYYEPTIHFLLSAGAISHEAQLSFSSYCINFGYWD